MKLTLDLAEWDTELAERAPALIRQWIDEADGSDDAPWDVLDPEFCYESHDYEHVMEDLVTTACGKAGLPALFDLHGADGYIDLIVDGENLIDGVRYILSPPYHMLGVDLASGYIDIKNTTSDRTAVGKDAAVAVILSAAYEYARLVQAYLRLRPAG